MNFGDNYPKKKSYSISTKFLVGIISIVTAVILAVIGFFSFSTTIPAGYVGAVYDRTVQKGDPRALEGFAGILKDSVSGFQWVNPFTQRISEYPVTIQTVYYSKLQNEGKKTDESIEVRSREGVLLPADSTMTLSFEQEKVPQVMAQFNGQDFQTLESGFIRSKVRQALSDVCGQYTVEELYGSKLGEASAKVKTALLKELGAYGIKLDTFSITKIYLTGDIEKSVNAKIQATQDAQKAQADLARIEVENKQKVEKAQADADASLAQKKAEADGILYTAQKQAEANREVSNSLTPNILAKMALDNEKLKYDKISPNIQFGLVPDSGNYFFGKEFGNPITVPAPSK